VGELSYDFDKGSYSVDPLSKDFN